LNEDYLKKALEIIPDHITLVLLSTKRSRELNRGSNPLVQPKLGELSLDIALREIGERKITFEYPE
jgi:DNA-directed RNA polymerase subunit omega